MLINFFHSSHISTYLIYLISMCCSSTLNTDREIAFPVDLQATTCVVCRKSVGTTFAVSKSFIKSFVAFSNNLSVVFACFLIFVHKSII